MNIEITKESFEIYTEVVKVFGKPHYLETDDMVMVWSISQNFYISFYISENERVQSRLVIDDSFDNNFNKIRELIILVGNKNVNLQYQFPRNYIDSTAHIMVLFSELEKKNKFKQEERERAIGRNIDKMGINMYIILHNNNLIDDNLRNILTNLKTFDFYDSISKIEKS